jgi:hypothetical protein
MDYYSEKQRANMRIYNMLQSAKASGTDLEVNKVIFDLTEQFKIGEHAVMKRILLIQSVDKDFDIKDGTIVFK